MSIPLLVGIVGHREVPAEYRRDLEIELRQALHEIRERAPNTPVVLASSLAEGADRIGARVGLAMGLEVIVPLPFEAEAFRQDFPESADEFDALLAQARCAFVANEPECEGYEAASRWIARHCQIVIALWDEEQERIHPGGTAHTVRLRHYVGEAGHTLASVADYLGPVLILHCPRTPGCVRRSPRWLCPGQIETATGLGQQLSCLDAFNAQAKQVAEGALNASLAQLPAELSHRSRLARAFAVADVLANQRQRRFHATLNVSVILAVAAYLIQQIWVTVPGKMLAFLFLALALGVIFHSRRASYHEHYLEYRALAEALRVACFWRLAGIRLTPTDHFLNQHWGDLRWVRGAVNALWYPDIELKPNLDLVKARWIDDQHAYHQKKGRASALAARRALFVANGCFVLATILSFPGVAYILAGDLVTTFSGTLLLCVGAISHYAHSRGWEEDAARHRAMAAPFSWCQQLWNHSDGKARLVLLQELGRECVAELSNWVLSHRARPVDLVKG